MGLSAPAPASKEGAATLKLKLEHKKVKRNKTIRLHVIADTNGEEVNSVQVYLKLKKGRLSCAEPASSVDSRLVVSATKCTSRVSAIALTTAPGTTFSGSTEVAVFLIRAGKKKGAATVSASTDATLMVGSTQNQNILKAPKSVKVTVR